MSYRIIEGQIEEGNVVGEYESAYTATRRMQQLWHNDVTRDLRLLTPSDKVIVTSNDLLEAA